MKNKVFLLFPFVFLSLAILHSIFPQITIDAITIALIILALFTWLPLLIKEISLPGGTKNTFRDVKEPSDNIIEEGKSENIEPKVDENESKCRKNNCKSTKSIFVDEKLLILKSLKLYIKYYNPFYIR